MIQKNVIHLGVVCDRTQEECGGLSWEDRVKIMKWVCSIAYERIYTNSGPGYDVIKRMYPTLESVLKEGERLLAAERKFMESE